MPITFDFTGADFSNTPAPPVGTLVINGVGLGTGPTVVRNENWGDASLGAASDINWDSGNYLTGLKPSVFAGWDGINGIGNREGGTNAATNNRMVGFTKAFPAFTDYFVAFETCVPSGRHFSGAAAPNTLPPASNLKMDWTSDDPLDNLSKADLVAFSRVSPTNFAVLGNQSTGIIYVDNGFDFDGWNGFQLTRTAGTPSPTLDNGITEVVQTTSAGTYTQKKIDAPTFNASYPAQYTHVNFPGWTGNDSQDLTQHLFSYYYRAHGPNCGKRVEVYNNATYALATKRRVVYGFNETDSWSDTVISCTPPAWMLTGMTHWAVVDTGTIITSGAI